jgi:uncharacterized membrane protein
MGSQYGCKSYSGGGNMTTNIAKQAAKGIEKSILIDAPLEKVFAYYANPENLPEIWPSLLEVSEVERTPEGWAKTFKWVYKMVGMRFEGSSEVTEYEANKRTLAVQKGGIESTIETVYEDHGGKTLVREHSQYRVPIPLLGKVAEKFLEKSNENELETIHANLKARMESDAT